MNQTEIITKTFDLLENLARAGVTRVTINQPPSEYASCTLPGVFALEPCTPKVPYRSPILWEVMSHHGGMTCGNSLGRTTDGTGYWFQAQAKEPFFTGAYTWIGEDVKDYRKWYCKEVVDIILNTN